MDIVFNVEKLIFNILTTRSIAFFVVAVIVVVVTFVVIVVVFIAIVVFVLMLLCYAMLLCYITKYRPMFVTYVEIFNSVLLSFFSLCYSFPEKTITTVFSTYYRFLISAAPNLTELSIYLIVSPSF